ncbi:MAG: hypothetical protein GF308_17005 [Candidatus Heimdallarchaeota archaeon]|nr:hypothetical protein [Candidatus Heimdallarchaeota archaeon]
MSNEEKSNGLTPTQVERLNQKAEELGYEKLAFFIDDLDMLLRPINLLKSKDMKYFELENLIALLDSKKISLGRAPRMISMVAQFSERNEKLEKENEELKQSNITIRSKYQTTLTQLEELRKQVKDLSAGPKTDAKIKEENIRLSEENKYLKLTNESLDEELAQAKEKLEEKLEEANALEIENSQMELRIRDLERELKETDLELRETQKMLEELEKEKKEGVNETIKLIEEFMDEIDALYESTEDIFKKEFLAFFGLELSEILDGRSTSKQKLLNQLSIHAREIEKVFETQIAAIQQVPSHKQPTTPEPQRETVPMKKPPEELIPEPVKRKPVKTEEEEEDEDKEEEEEEEKEDSYVKPSEFLKKKGVEVETAPKEEPEEEKKEPKKKVTRAKKKKAPASDRKPSKELVEVFDIFIKYLDAEIDRKTFESICDKIIEDLYEHIGSAGMTKVYKIKSGGLKRKKMLIDLLKKWKVQLPEF